MTNAQAAEALIIQAIVMGIHTRACIAGTAPRWGEGWSEGCAVCDQHARAFADWEINGTERAIEAMYDAHASIQTEIDAAQHIARF